MLNVLLADGSIDPNRIALGAAFTGADIDPNLETITFATPHNLRDNDSVVYRPVAPAVAVSGLSANAIYTVRVIDARTIQLKLAVPNVDTITAANVAGDTTINHAHTFTNRQAVTYHAPPQRTFATAQVDVTPAFNAGGQPIAPTPANNDRIYFFNASGNEVSHGFAVNERVLYTAQTGGTAIDPLRSGTIYRVLAVPSTGSLQLAPTVTGSLTFTRAVTTGPVADQHRAFVTGVNWLAQGFQVGHSFTISGAGDNNGTYTVAAVDATRLEITTDFASAGTLADKTIDGNTAILLDPIKVGDADDIVTPPNTIRPSATVHSLVRPGDRPFANLVDGRTYYVFNPTNSTTSYQLTDTPTGTVPLTLGTAGLGTTATHRFAAESVDLGPSAADGGHQFRINILASTVDTQFGPQRIVGPGGVALATLAPPPGDGVSTASATGSGGGFVGVNDNSIDRHHERDGDGPHRLRVPVRDRRRQHRWPTPPPTRAPPPATTPAASSASARATPPRASRAPPRPTSARTRSSARAATSRSTPPRCTPRTAARSPTPAASPRT